MAVSGIVKTKGDGTITFTDGTRSLVVDYEVGDFSIDIPQEAIVNTLNRGIIGDPPSLRKGADQPVTFSFSAYLRDLQDGTVATLEALLSGLPGAAANWVSTLGASAEVFTVTTTFVIEGSDHGDAKDYTITLPYCVLRGSFSEGDPSTINVTGTCFQVRPTITIA